MACVLSADAHGFSQRMLRNERVTIDALLASRQIFKRVIASHNGTIIDMAGDNVLAHFPSSRGALDCSLSIQRTLRARENSGESPHLPFRIGLCAGEIWFGQENGRRTIYGNAVNRASRIQSLAGPHKVAITLEIYNELRELCESYAANEIGGPGKPGEPPIRAIELDPSTVLSKPNTRPARLPSSARLRVPPSVIIVPSARIGRARGTQIVLAFVESLVSRSFTVRVGETVPDLGRCLPSMLRNDRPRDDYFILVGESAKKRDHISVYLYSTLEERFVFSRFFCSQPPEQLSAGIATTSELIGETIERCEAHSGPIRNLRAQGSFRTYLAAKQLIHSFTQEGTLKGIQLLKKALEIDPEFPRAHSLLGKAYSIAWRFDWPTDSTDPQKVAIDHTYRAVRLDPTDAVCEAEHGFTLLWGREHERSLISCHRALQMDPNNSTIAADVGMIYSYLKEKKKAIEVLENSLKLDCFNPDYRLWSLGNAYHAERNYEKAMAALLKMRDPSQSYRLLAVCSIHLGQNPTPYVQKILEQQPTFSVRRWVDIQPLEDQEEAEEFADDLLRAGLPK